MKKHLTSVAALHIGLGIFRILVVVTMFLIMDLIGAIADDPHAHFILSYVSMLAGIIVLVISIPGIVGGIGLFSSKNWARVLLLIVSALNLLCIPFGTALGVYSIWVLVQDDTVKIIRKQQ